MRVLVIGAHPDDELLGVGGTICRHVSLGDDVFVCIATKAHEPGWSKQYMKDKVAEQRKVDRLLKITRRYNLDLPTTMLNLLPHGELNKKIGEVVEKVSPDVIYTHFEGDLNQDHAIIFNATMVAARPPKKIKLLCYETLSETEWGGRAFQPNAWVDISKFIGKKIKAFDIYRSEVKKFPHPRSNGGITALARKRGTEAGLENAEAFIIMKEVWV